MSEDVGEPEERPEGASGAVEKAEAARLRLEAELVAQSLAKREAIRRLPQDLA